MTTFATGGGEETTRSSATSETAPGVVTKVRASKVLSANADGAAASATSPATRVTASFAIRPPGCEEVIRLPYGRTEEVSMASATLGRGHVPPSPHRLACRRGSCHTARDSPDTRTDADAGRRVLAPGRV